MENEARQGQGLARLRQGEWSDFLVKHHMPTNHHTLTRRLSQLAQGQRKVGNMKKEDIITLVQGCGGPWLRSVLFL